MKTNITKKEMEKAEGFIKALLKTDNTPEDEWFTISDDWDLNVWTDDDEKKVKAVMYPVTDGETDTSVWHELYIRHLLPCERCNGAGELEDFSDHLYLSMGVTKFVECPDCNGKG
jgi:hypothetical protein